MNLGLCLQKHPIELGREWLNQRHVTPITQLQKRPHGSKVSVAGLVTHRQRPQTASGVMFLGMEDETGITNIVVWPKIYERQRRLIRSEGLLLVRGTLQKEREAISVVARSFEVLPLEGISAKSRDFR